MACGVPVICSNSSSLPEVVGEAALLVNPKDGRAWTEAMRSVLEDPCLRKELREKGLVQSTKFSWDRTAKETLAVYRYALGATSTRKSEDHQGTRR
jgi:glycosyltransferase involved in cell wall biosynthesis